MLGAPEGIEGILNGNSILKWLQQGSRDEDHPPCRASNHFHNPRLPWDQSYNTDAPDYLAFWCHDVTPAWPLFSNITWATDFTYINTKLTIPPEGQEMNWDNARTYFHQALTSANKTERDDNFIKTFIAVGQVMHLLQDMAVPAHVRNDFQSHLVFHGIKLNTSFTSWWGNPFEHYVKNHPTLISAADPVVPTLTNPRLTDFWDTTDTAGDSPGNGLAEVINGGYLSDQTIPGNNYAISDPYYNVHMFPLPQLVTGMQNSVDYLPNAKKPTRYLSRQVCPSCDGRIDHFVAYSLLTSEAEIKAQTPNPNLRKYYLDNNVHKTYAGEILPMAIGYSASLLDYFFRGTIELSLPARGVYALAAPDGQFTEIRVRAKNTTASTEEMNNGSIQLVIKYRLADSDPFQSEPVDVGPESYIVVPEKNNLTGIPRNTTTELVFDLSVNQNNPLAHPLPLWATDVTMQVVYKGQLGNETGAVALGFRDISEPTPIDVVNNMDHVCIYGNYMVPGSSDAIDAVDFDDDDDADWDVFRHGLLNVHVSFNGNNASSSNYSATFASIPPGNYGRVFVLADYSTPTVSTLLVSTDQTVQKLDPDNDIWNLYFLPEVFAIDALTNNDEYSPDFYFERGLISWWYTYYENAAYPTGSTCDSTSAQPDLSGPVAVTLN
jgi:hypothetical protein